MASNDITGSFELMPRQVEKEGKDEKVDKEIKESTEKESKEKIDKDSGNMEKESGKMDKESEFADIPQTEKEAKEKEEKVSKETTTEEEFGQGDLIDSNDALDAWLAEQEEGTVLLPPPLPLSTAMTPPPA